LSLFLSLGAQDLSPQAQISFFSLLRRLAALPALPIFTRAYATNRAFHLRNKLFASHKK
jgi:hypothetical protein